ncbi:MAG: flippase activity-associated protein Agl23 [bacterium]
MRAPLPEIAILVLAVFLRCWLIEIKPPHFDEGINGWFADQMTANGYYRYDPTNYHGPLHFYAVFLSQTLFGREVWALRLPAMIASILAVWAMLRFREFFGLGVSRLAALAMTLSPAFVFYGRYSIHESWQVLFSILLLHGLLGLWQTGTRRHFFTMLAGAVGLILTKETYVVHMGCMALAALTLWIYQILVPSRPVWPIARQQWTRDDAILGAGVAALLIVFFYSGTFRDFRALSGLYESFHAWISTGVQSSGHEKKAYDMVGPLNWYWVHLMARYEWPALAGALACLRYVFPSDARYRYTAILGAGTLLAYSIIPYKTPWCVISMLWPFYITLGGVVREWAGRAARDRVWLVAVPLLAVSGYMMVRLNFFRFTDDSEPYVYVQTYKDIERFTKPVLAVAKSEPEGYQMEGVIMLDSYYPLPWIFGNFTRVGYFKKEAPPARWDADFVLIEASNAARVEPNFHDSYYKIPFRLRSGQEECVAYLAARKFSGVVPGEPDFHPVAEEKR